VGFFIFGLEVHMRHISCLLAVALSFASLTASAATATRPSAAVSPAVEGASGKTEIVPDQKAHVVRVFVDDKKVVANDARGLHVKGDIVVYSETNH
jgi:hypothetical protein